MPAQISALGPRLTLGLEPVSFTQVAGRGPFVYPTALAQNASTPGFYAWVPSQLVGNPSLSRPHFHYQQAYDASA